MPDLSHLDDKNMLNVVLNALVGDRGASGLPDRPLMNHGCLMDKTIISYNGARDELDRYIHSEGNVLSPLIRAHDHLETCVDTLWRVALMSSS